MTITVQPTAPSGSPPRVAGPKAKVTQPRVIRSEWLKLISLRSSWLTILAAVVGMVGVGLLVSALTNAHWSQMRPEERAAFDPTSRSLAGVYLAQLAVGVLGVLIISGEYATGMIRATFSAVPTRLPVLWAKLGVFATATFVLMTGAAFAAFLGGQRLLTSHGTTLGAHDVLRSVIGVGLYLTVVAVLGIALGFIIRSTAGGIAALFGLLLVLPVLGNVLPSSWQHDVLPYLPSNAGAALTSVRIDANSLAPWTGFGVMCLWAVAAVVAAAILVRRRDA